MTPNCRFQRLFFARPGVALLALALPLAVSAQQGIFEDHGDIGTVLHKGAVEFDAAKGSYRITGSGENLWAAADAFQFV